MAGMQICLVLTVMALLCQAVGIFLPGWIVPNGDLQKIGIQYGVWYQCIDWKICGHYFDAFKAAIQAKSFSSGGVYQIILIVTESLAFLVLAVASAVAGMGACSKRSYFTLLSGLNMAACFLIMCGVLNSVTIFVKFETVPGVSYGYSFYLACAGAFLSLVSGCLTCCFNEPDEKSSYRSRRHEHPADKQYNDQQYYQDYQHQQQNYPMGYGGAAPFYG